MKDDTKGFILDVDTEGSNVLLYIKTADGIRVLKDEYHNYFYMILGGPSEDGNNEREIVKRLESNQSVSRVEKLKRIVDGKEREVLKISVKEQSALQNVRDTVKELGETREYSIGLADRYMIDKGIVPMRVYKISKTENELEFKAMDEELGKDIPLDGIAFDIEVYNPKGVPDPSKDPVIMISYASGRERGVLTWKDIDLDFVSVVEDEKECISELEKRIQDYDIVYTYNGDNFDLPYLRKRKGKLGLGFEGKNVHIRKSRVGYFAQIPGRAHVDVFHAVKFLEGIGAVRILRYTLEDVYKAILGKEKIDIDTRQLWTRWDKGTREELEELARYSLQDSLATYELGDYVIPLFIELSRLTGKTLYHTVRISASHVVESILLREAHSRGEIIPRRPKEREVIKRIRGTIKGAYVKEPVPGLHENIAVLDFASLYPSIIISHNVDPFTLVRDDDMKKEGISDYFESPNGYKFRKDREGLIPSMLKKLLKKRREVKREMKKHNKESLEYKMLNARQQSLKIAANATYGYLNYARARWYSKECAEAITAWGRYYVKNLISEAEKAGFEVLYADTDSAFLKLGNKEKADVIHFLKDFNSKLPEFMELELEGFYVRGIFVTRKIGKGAAKKRYALLGENGEMKITGLEFVRTDWSEIAKEVQRDVLRLVLQGDIEEAKDRVKETIARIRKGGLPLDKYVIYTQLKQDFSQYEAIGPHVKAAKRLSESGHIVVPGMLIGYIVVAGGGNIGDKSYPYYPVNLVGNRKPDPEYYINNQVLPAVMKILGELGISEDDLREGGKQVKLERWF